MDLIQPDRWERAFDDRKIEAAAEKRDDYTVVADSVVEIGEVLAFDERHVFDPVVDPNDGDRLVATCRAAGFDVEVRDGIAELGKHSPMFALWHARCEILVLTALKSHAAVLDGAHRFAEFAADREAVRLAQEGVPRRRALLPKPALSLNIYITHVDKCRRKQRVKFTFRRNSAMREQVYKRHDRIIGCSLFIAGPGRLS